MKILSFNIRCPWKDRDGINDFIHRAGFIYDKIRAEQPDVIAFQEVRKDTLELLQKMLSEYTFFGAFRESGTPIEGLYTAIRTEAFAFLACEVFWLSPTPFVVGSRFAEQSKCPRICVMTKIKNKKTNQVFRLLNIHLDHISDSARRLGMDCIFSFLDEYEQREQLPSVLLGDFNAEPNDDVMCTCRKRSDVFDATASIRVTFHGYGSTAKKIDYIFLSEIWRDRVVDVSTWEDVHEGIYLSDHYPVCLQINDN